MHGFWYGRYTIWLMKLRFQSVWRMRIHSLTHSPSLAHTHTVILAIHFVVVEFYLLYKSTETNFVEKLTLLSRINVQSSNVVCLFEFVIFILNVCLIFRFCIAIFYGFNTWSFFLVACRNERRPIEQNWKKNCAFNFIIAMKLHSYITYTIEKLIAQLACRQWEWIYSLFNDKMCSVKWVYIHFSMLIELAH